MNTSLPSSLNQRHNKSLNIVFAGTPDFSASILEALLAQGHHISAVYCQPDRRVGRGKKLTHGPVKQLAVSHNIPVEQPVRFNDDLISGDLINSDAGEQALTPLEKLMTYKADLMIVVAYGLILPEAVLAAPKYGCVNIHASLLPRWRGAAPIQRAIQAGDSETGITIMQMDKGLDTGNMLLKYPCPIEVSDTGSSLHDKLASIGCQLINQFLESYQDDTAACSKSTSRSKLSPGEVQNNDLANYAHKLNKAEAEIDWNQSAQKIEQQIRAFNSWPVSFTHVGNNRLRIWQAELSKNTVSHEYSAGQIVQSDKQGIIIQCGDGYQLMITHLQADGSRAMSVAELLNGKGQWFIDHAFLGRRF